MRLFIALPIPKAIKQQLVDLKQPIEGVRWQKASQIHLTLKFIGESSLEQASALKDQLKEVAMPIFNITLKGFGYFPKGKQPRVLWAAIDKNNSLQKLHKQVEHHCEELGFEAEDRPFKPHITLARMDGAPKRDIMSFVNQHKQVQIPDITMKEFVLYESKLHSDGAKHNRLKSFTLEA